MVEPTAREMAWLRSIEPPLPYDGAVRRLEPSTIECLNTARAAISRSRLLLTTTQALLPPAQATRPADRPAPPAP